MGEIEEARVEQVEIRRADRPGDLGWVLMAHGEIYAAEFGWNVEAVTARIVADYSADHDPEREAAWIAEVDGRRMGCVFCVAEDETTARLRILLVHPEARGRRLGGRLVDICVGFARAAGYARMRLWTNHPLVIARRIYLDRGFVLTGERAHRTFGIDLIGQTYDLDLDVPSPASSARQPLDHRAPARS